MLLGALPLEAELLKRRFGLLNSDITSNNEYLKGLVQRQLVCSFNVQSSFFFITSKILEEYELPSLSQLMCSSYSKAPVVSILYPRPPTPSGTGIGVE